MTNKEILQEGIFDWIQRNKEGYKKQISGESSEADEGILTKFAGGVGTGLGKATKFTQDTIAPTVGRGLQSFGKRLEGSERKSNVFSDSKPISVDSKPEYSIKNIVKNNKNVSSSKEWGTKFGNLSNLNSNLGPAVTAGIAKSARNISNPYSIKNITSKTSSSTPKTNVITFKPKRTIH